MFHLEMGVFYKLIERTEVYHRAHGAAFLGTNERLSCPEGFEFLPLELGLTPYNTKRHTTKGDFQA